MYIFFPLTFLGGEGDESQTVAFRSPAERAGSSDDGPEIDEMVSEPREDAKLVEEEACVVEVEIWFFTQGS